MRSFIFVLTLCVGFITVLFSLPAHAQAVCGPHSEVVKKLEGDFKEARAGLGLAGNGGLVELFVSEKGGWSVLVTRPNGVTCLVAAGENWEIITPVFVEEPEDLS